MPTADSSTTPSRSAPAAAEGAEQTTTLTLRRAPKVSVFLCVGGVVGLIIGIVVGVLGAGNVSFTSGQVIGYMATIFALLGVAVGALVFLLAERRSMRRAHEVQAYSESGRGSAQDPDGSRTDRGASPAVGEQAPEPTPDRSDAPRADVED